MPDVFTRSQRSEVMARIRSRGNRDTELALARLLRAHGLKGWRRHVKVPLQRAPRGRGSRAGVVQIDFVFPGPQVAVFVDGCFWHGCPRHSPPARWLKKSSMPLVARESPGAQRTPRTGKAFWRRKLAANMARDRFVSRQLRRQGWCVIRVWEHELAAAGPVKSGRGPLRVVARIRRALANRSSVGRAGGSSPGLGR
ncbi:MAG: very short patch repair endonuclease [Thermogemmata sp.]